MEITVFDLGQLYRQLIIGQSLNSSMDRFHFSLPMSQCSKLAHSLSTLFILNKLTLK